MPLGFTTEGADLLIQQGHGFYLVPYFDEKSPEEDYLFDGHLYLRTLTEAPGSKFFVVAEPFVCVGLSAEEREGSSPVKLKCTLELCGGKGRRVTTSTPFAIQETYPSHLMPVGLSRLKVSLDELTVVAAKDLTPGSQLAESILGPGEISYERYIQHRFPELVDNPPQRLLVARMTAHPIP